MGGCTHSALDNVALLQDLLHDIIVLTRAELALESSFGGGVQDTLVAVSIHRYPRQPLCSLLAIH